MNRNRSSRRKVLGGLVISLLLAVLAAGCFDPTTNCKGKVHGHAGWTQPAIYEIMRNASELGGHPIKHRASFATWFGNDSHTLTIQAADDGMVGVAPGAVSVKEGTTESEWREAILVLFADLGLPDPTFDGLVVVPVEKVACNNW